MNAILTHSNNNKAPHHPVKPTTLLLPLSPRLTVPVLRRLSSSAEAPRQAKRHISTFKEADTLPFPIHSGEHSNNVSSSFQDMITPPPSPEQTAKYLIDFPNDTSKTVLSSFSESKNRAASNEMVKMMFRGKFEEGRVVFAAILDRNELPAPESMGDAIALAGKQGHIELALDMYRRCVEAYKVFEHANPDDVADAIYRVTNSILISYAQQGDMKMAKVYFDTIKALGRTPDGDGYASLLLGCARSTTDEATDALTIYEEAKRHGVKPTTFFYNVVISKLAKARKLDSALFLFQEMKQRKVTPNAITYAAILSASVRAGSEMYTSRFFAEMLAASPANQLRIGPFNNMIQFYVRQKPNRARALEYFGKLRQYSITPSAHTYTLLLEAYTTIAPYDMATAHDILTTMGPTDGIQPQPAHYAILIRSYGTLQHNLVRAEQVFEDLQKAKIAADEVVYQALLDTLIGGGAMTKAETVYTTMCKSIKSSTPYIENLFIRGYGQAGQLDKAESIFHAMSDTKHTKGTTIREPSTYEAMVRAYLAQGKVKKASQTLERMDKRGFPVKVAAAVADLVRKHVACK